MIGIITKETYFFAHNFIFDHLVKCIFAKWDTTELNWPSLVWKLIQRPQVEHILLLHFSGSKLVQDTHITSFTSIYILRLLYNLWRHIN